MARTGASPTTTPPWPPARITNGSEPSFTTTVRESLLTVLLTDLIGATVSASEKVHFELGEPLPPFEQLLSVLPPDGMDLLPEPYRRLVSSPSPLTPYFPSRVRIDSEGKRNAWEFVVLVPFLPWDEPLRAFVRQAVPPECLTQDERRRNTFGPAWRFHYHASDPAAQGGPDTGYRFPSSLPASWPDIDCCHVRCHQLKPPS